MALTEPERPEVDLEEVQRLMAAIERDLDAAPQDSAAVQRLKDEVETLRTVLEARGRQPPGVRGALHDMREAFHHARDTAVADALKASRYIAEIGRILGM